MSQIKTGKIATLYKATHVILLQFFRCTTTPIRITSTRSWNAQQRSNLPRLFRTRPCASWTNASSAEATVVRQLQTRLRADTADTDDANQRPLQLVDEQNTGIVVTLPHPECDYHGMTPEQCHEAGAPIKGILMHSVVLSFVNQMQRH